MREFLQLMMYDRAWKLIVLVLKQCIFGNLSACMCACSIIQDSDMAYVQVKSYFTAGGVPCGKSNGTGRKWDIRRTKTCHQSIKMYFSLEFKINKKVNIILYIIKILNITYVKKTLGTIYPKIIMYQMQQNISKYRKLNTIYRNVSKIF